MLKMMINCNDIKDEKNKQEHKKRSCGKNNNNTNNNNMLVANLLCCFVIRQKKELNKGTFKSRLEMKKSDLQVLKQTLSLSESRAWNTLYADLPIRSLCS